MLLSEIDRQTDNYIFKKSLKEFEVELLKHILTFAVKELDYYRPRWGWKREGTFEWELIATVISFATNLRLNFLNKDVEVGCMNIGKEEKWKGKEKKE